MNINQKFNEELMALIGAEEKEAELWKIRELKRLKRDKLEETKH